MISSTDDSTSQGSYRLAADTFGPEEMAAVHAVLASGQFTMGRKVAEFEAAFANWVGIDHAVMVNSGSSANLLMVELLRRNTAGTPILESGDEVLVPGLSWPTTVWPIAQLGLTPVFVDVDPETLAIDLDSAQQALSERTRGMFLIHALGRAAELSRYRAFCDDNSLVLLEDCCESLGAHWEENHVGSAGLAASFSFYFSHHISTIEGGMVVTSEAAVADDLRGLRAHGWIRDRSDRAQWIAANPGIDPRFLFATVGYNVRPTEVQAAIGLVQLGRLDQLLFARETLAHAVSGWLQTYAPWLELIGRRSIGPRFPDVRRSRTHSWMTLPLRVRSDAPVDRAGVVDTLEAAGVETRPIIAGNLSRHPGVKQVSYREAPSMRHCDALLTDSFMIGCHPVLSSGSLSTLEAAIGALAKF